MQPSGPTFKRFLFLALVGLLKKPTRAKVGKVWQDLGFSEQEMALRRNVENLHNHYDVIIQLDKTIEPEEGGTYVIKHWSFIDEKYFLWKFRLLLRNYGVDESELREDDTETSNLNNPG